MPRNPCGLKVGTRNIKVVVTLPRALAGNEYATFTVHLADLEGGGDPLFLIAALTITPASQPDLPNTFRYSLTVQDFSKGPIVGYGEGGFARIKLTFVDASANLNIAIIARVELQLSTQTLYQSPDQPIAQNQTLDWFITS